MSICWDCKRAVGGCSWSELNDKADGVRFQPVEGWKATISTNIYSDGKATYEVRECPLFIADKKEAREEKEQIVFALKVLAMSEEEKKERIKEEAKEWREKKKAAGLCARCGGSNEREGKTECEKCAKIRSIRHRERKMEKETGGAVCHTVVRDGSQ